MDFDRDYGNERKGKPSKIVISAIIAMILVGLYLLVPATSKAIYAPPRDNITVVTNLPYPPFEDLVGGEFTGLDIDIAYKFGDKYNARVIVTDVPEFDDVFLALKDGKADMAISAITISSGNSSRSNLSDFSIGYYNASQAVLAMENGKFKIANELFADDFKGMRIGYQGSTTNEGWAAANLFGKVDLAGNISFGDVDSGLQILRSGDIDGIILDEPAARALAKKNPGMVVAGVINNTQEEYGIAVKKGDPKKLLPKINELIKELKENGEYEKLIKKHFGGGQK